MRRQRVWLSSWEWECCGDGFSPGKEIALEVDRPAPAWLAELVGSEMAEGIDAVESHHEHPGAERLKGVVRAISAVVVEHDVRRVRREGPVAEPRPPVIGGGDGELAWAAGPVSPWFTTSTPVPGTASLRAVAQVPPPARPGTDPAADESALPDQERRGFIEGFLVDLDPVPSGEPRRSFGPSCTPETS